MHSHYRLSPIWPSLLAVLTQVIGGVQRFKAIQAINLKRPEAINSRKCAVYGSGISIPAALTLAQQHNECNQLQRATTFSEIAGTCRRLLFNKFGPDLDDCPDCKLPNIPRYNSKPYRDFKKECISIIVNTQTVSIDKCCTCIVMFRWYLHVYFLNLV